MAALPAHRVAGLYLARRVRFGMKLGLEAMRALVAEMGHPERAYPSLLIAGTNGKGSVAAYCDAALRASGLRTGRYTSPHLVRVNERITVDGHPITDHDFAIAVRAVRDAAERLVRRGVLEAHPTFFEVTTAAAFAHFRRRRVDVAVLEAGLGGRLDATNVVEPTASAIVSIDFDHEVYLGRTLAAIAGEKAGVLREGRTSVIGPLPDEARRAVRTRARAIGARVVEARRGARFVRCDVGAAASRRRGLADTFDLLTPTTRYARLQPLPGAHQRDNLLVAIRLLEEAKRAGSPDRPAEGGSGDRRHALARAPRVGPRALRRSSSTEPTTAPARAPSPRTFAAGRRSSSSSGRCPTRTCAASRTSSSRWPSRSSSRGHASRAPRRRTISPAGPAASPKARTASRASPVLSPWPDASRCAHGPMTTVVVAGSLYLVGAVKAVLEREAARS